MRIPKILHLILFAAAVLLAGCSTLEEEKPYDGPLFWPQPPDQPRFAFETVLRSPADIAAVSEDDQLKATLTGKLAVSEEAVLDKPSAIVARFGRVFVADSSTHSIVSFDIPRRRIFRFGTREPGNLMKPAGLAVDDQLKVYVADSKARKVFVYDKLGLILGFIGGPDDLERPSGVAVSRDGERIYVIDRSYNENSHHVVVQYDKDGKKIREIGSRGNEDGQFNVPTQGVVGPDGTLYVLDAGNFRVQAFDPEGKFLRSFGRPGKEFGSFGRPRGIAVDEEGNVYVTDASFNNFQIFNPKGELLMAIGQYGVKKQPGVYGMVNGIAVDETNRVYVVDQMYNLVEVIRRLSDEEGKQIVALSKKDKKE